jgi:hypothetical protein
MARSLKRSWGGLRRARWPLLVLGVLLAHLGVVDQMAAAVAARSDEARMPPRLQVAFVREMTAAEPLPVRAVPAPPSPRPLTPRAVASPAPELPRAVEPAASAPAMPEPAEVSASAAVPSVPPVPESTVAVGNVDDAPLASAEVADALPPPDDAASAPAFRWPASTRLSYRLSGQFRGEVHGQAQVEWILDAPRYQVNLDVQVGLPFAPLFSRQMRSDGVLSPAGLHPRHYVEDNQMAFRDRRRLSLALDEGGVTLAQGLRWVRPSGTAAGSPGAPDWPDMPVQDSASQFVQLSYLFTTAPERLQVGRQITLALALPRRVLPWVYEVVAEETLHTPFGPVQTFHVRPHPDTPRGRDLLAEAWFAPQWGYLPVRIRIEQDAEVFVDLVIERKPELAAP